MNAAVGDVSRSMLASPSEPGVPLDDERSEMTAQHSQSVDRRATRWGRWLPVGFYVTVVALWLVAGVQAHAGDLLWLALLAVPALALYMWRTRRRRP